MTFCNRPEQDLLKELLEPLLADFQHWFDGARNLLESEEIPFLSPIEQNALLHRIKQRQQEVRTAKMLFEATEQQIGIEMSALLGWNQLVTECWQVSFRLRTEQQQPRSTQ